MSALYAPGARVVIWDCEWIVRRADASDDGGYVITVDGLSALVNGKSARFLTRLVGVGLPRKANMKELNEGTFYCIDTPESKEGGIALGREDIQHLQEGSVYKTYLDDTLPGGPVERIVEYKAPFFRPDREEDYRVAWEVFRSQNR